LPTTRPDEMKGLFTLEIDALEDEIETNESVEKNPRLAVRIFVESVEIYESLTAMVLIEKDEKAIIFAANTPVEIVFVFREEINADSPVKFDVKKVLANPRFAAKTFVDKLENRTKFA
jgi:hypothetical protein